MPPGRASLMSAKDMFDITQSSYGGMAKALSNKRAIDHAFRQHQWEMERQHQAGEEQRKTAGVQHQYQLDTLDHAVKIKAINNKQALTDGMQRHQWEMEKLAQGQTGKEKVAHISGGYRLADRQMQSDANSWRPHDRAANYATQMLSKQFDLSPGTPEYNQAWQQAYQTILPYIMGQDGQMDQNAGNATGQGLGQGLAAGMMSGGIPSQDQTQDMGSSFGPASAGPSMTAPVNSQTGGYQEGMSAYNPKTGQRLYFMGGKWVKK